MYILSKHLLYNPIIPSSSIHLPLISSHISISLLHGGLLPHEHVPVERLHVGDHGIFSHEFWTPHLQMPSLISHISWLIEHWIPLQGSIIRNSVHVWRNCLSDQNNQIFQIVLKLFNYQTFLYIFLYKDIDPLMKSQNFGYNLCLPMRPRMGYRT